MKPSVSSPAKSRHGLEWHDAREWGVEGKGWSTTMRYYDRLPLKAKRLLPDLWGMSRHSTGLSVSFETDATDIHARWQLGPGPLDEPNMSRAAFSGLDLYACDKSKWRWIGVACRFDSRKPREQLITGQPPEKRAFRVYLPLRNTIGKFEIGVPRGSVFRGLPPRTECPIVYYGSSVAHGAYASRPGMVHPSMLGRWLDRPMVNLGFSGQAKMHQAMATLLAEIDAGMFVIDAMPNMDAQMVKERAGDFLRTLCKARPNVPVVVVEGFALTNNWIYPELVKSQMEKWKQLSRVCRRLLDEGYANLHYLKGRHALEDNEGTLDGVHPNDLGYHGLATHLFQPLQTIIQRTRPQRG